MIWRWSHINNINNDFLNSYGFERRFKIKAFRSAVNFKRFTLRFSKYKRKGMARLKHKSNWVIYSNIIRLWTNDFKFHKHHTKFQFHNGLMQNNILAYNFNFIKIRYDEFSYNFNFFISIWTKKSHNYYFKNNSLVYFKNTNYTHVLAHGEPVFNNSVVPVFFEWDNILYPYKPSTNDGLNNIFSFNEIVDICSDVILSQIVEIRKIITLLFYLVIHK